MFRFYWMKFLAIFYLYSDAKRTTFVFRMFPQKQASFFTEMQRFVNRLAPNHWTPTLSTIFVIKVFSLRWKWIICATSSGWFLFWTTRISTSKWCTWFGTPGRLLSQDLIPKISIHLNLSKLIFFSLLQTVKFCTDIYKNNFYFVDYAQ